VLSLPRGRRVLVVDAAVVLWVVAWIAIGVAVGATMSQLGDLTGAFREVGGAISGVGETLGAIQVPLLGGPLERASDAVTTAGRDVSARGDAVRSEIDRASILLGATVALGPILIALLPYLPSRLARARETDDLRRLVAEGGAAPELESLLAERALRSLPYDRLRAVGPRPWEDDLVTRRALAEEELARLDVRPPWHAAGERMG
jgi:hypothetical protein